MNKTAPHTEHTRAEDDAIRFQNVSIGYGGHLVAAGLSFTIRKAEYVCVVGENGSGKSTLIKSLLGLTAPLSGEIRFSGALKRNEAGYLSQQSAAKNDFPASVREIVLSGMAGRMGLRPFYSRKEKEEARENMKRLEVEELKGRCFRELSGGQQRRVLIARALCASQKLLVLDEPAAGLDPPATASLYALLEKMNKQLGVTLIIVSHDISASEKYAGRILHLKNGGAFFGTAAEYQNSPFAAGFANAAQRGRHGEEEGGADGL